MVQDEFCIIANNCWGAEVYKRYNKPFNTPIIGLYFYPEDYLNFISDLRKNLTTEVSFIKESRNIQNQKHPVGVINDIEVHFLHYDSEEEAYDKWTRRCKRVPEDISKLHFKFDDRDGATPEHIQRFHSMKHPLSICFTKDDYPELPNNLRIPMSGSEPNVMDGYDQFYVADNYFSLDDWIQGKGIVQTPTHKMNLASRKVKLALGMK